ncbi:MAG TPA: DNA-directed RNA polymerase subunit alpha [Candidatus Acetothermia bacterium]|nr:DNA-directed RNA polymerase subunit alpha [Candidatus Acetothermia bacterium]
MASFVYPETATWVEPVEPRYGRLIVAPLERGYATTLGNALRRVLLSAIPGAAVVRVLFPGRFHEYDTIPGVREDVLHIILNLKGLAIRSQDEALHRLYVSATGPGEVRAGDIETPAGVEITNPDHVIATLEKNGKLEVEMEVEVGRGFRSAEENKREDAPVSLIPVDADFSPIERVNFTVEATRVGGRSGYERLLLDVWTNGAITPPEAVGQAVRVLREHLAVLDGARGEHGEGEAIPAAAEEMLQPLIELGFEVRACNLLREEGVITLQDLLAKTREEVSDIHGFGERTLARLEERLGELGYALRSEKED